MPEMIELICLFVMGLTFVTGCLQTAFFIARFVAALVQPPLRGDTGQAPSIPISVEADWSRLGEDYVLQAA